MRYIKTFNEKKKEDKVKDQEMGFDSKSIVPADDQKAGFKTEVEEIKDKDAKKIVDEVESAEKDVTKGSIKK